MPEDSDSKGHSQDPNSVYFQNEWILVGWMVATKKLCPNPQNLCMLHYLERVLADVIKLRLLRWDLPGLSQCPKSSDTEDRKKRRWGEDRQRLQWYGHKATQQPEAKEYKKQSSPLEPL